MTGTVARPARRSSARWLALGVLVATGVVAWWFAAEPSGRVVAELVAAEPPADARLASPPTAVSLRFSQPLDPGRSHVAVAGPGGGAATGEAVTSGGTIRQPVALPGDGTVLVSYHVRFQDGRELSGAHRFTVGAGGGLSPVDSTGGGGHAHGDLGPFGAAMAAAILAGGAAVVGLMFRRGRPR